MLSKSFALFAAFAAFAPAFAAPVPADVLGVDAVVKDVANDLKAGVLTRSDPVNAATFEEVVKMLELSRRTEDSGCSLVDVDAIINNVLNNGSISILSSKRSDCDVVGVTAEVKNVLNNLHVSVLSTSKRGEGYCSLADVEAVVTDVANNMNINVLTQKRGDCDVVKVTAIVKNLLENLNVNVLTQSKRSTYSVSDIATQAKNILEGKTSKRDELANVVVDVVHNVDDLTANVLKRADVDVYAEVKNVLNKAKIQVA